MEKTDWMKLTTAEIKIKQMTLEREYDYIKNEINKLLTKLSMLDEEYLKAENELLKRSGK